MARRRLPERFTLPLYSTPAAPAREPTSTGELFGDDDYHDNDDYDDDDDNDNDNAGSPGTRAY